MSPVTTARDIAVSGVHVPLVKKSGLLEQEAAAGDITHFGAAW